MIRSFEKSHPTHLLSTRATLNGRVPIIAVSASLEEKARPTYIEAGFDGWILKPIDFNRLAQIMTGIVDKQIRRGNLYKTGNWERGGWFEEAQPDVFAANTKPSAEPPTSAPGHSGDSEGVKIAAAVDDPSVKEEDASEQSKEQQRLLAEQETERERVSAAKATSLPELGSKEHRSNDTSAATIIHDEDRRHASPPPITPETEQAPPQ
jgi:DNA-binding response OmpR family regulator